MSTRESVITSFHPYDETTMDIVLFSLYYRWEGLRILTHASLTPMAQELMPPFLLHLF